MLFMKVDLLINIPNDVNDINLRPDLSNIKPI